MLGLIMRLLEKVQYTGKKITEQVRNQYHEKAKERIKKNYSWELICSCYEKKIKEISE